MQRMEMDTESVKRLARELGFVLCGVAEARPSDHGPELRDWLDAGKHGTMDWLARNVDVRIDPDELLPGARSIICVADRIGSSEDSESQISNLKSEIPNHTPPHPGRIARYAQIDDYHKIIKKRLFGLADALREHAPDHAFKACVDTAPIMEREHAMRAGLGWVGKNTLLLHPRAGSHLLLGELATTLPLTPDAPETDHCGSCTRCIDACPTDCITPYSLDASRCISYLTIEHREAIDPDFHEPIGEWIYGCDICQDVCPFNRADRSHRLAEERIPPLPPEYGRRPATMDVAEVMGWGEGDRRAAFTRSPMKRAKLDQMKRNALIVAGNRLRDRRDPSLRERIAAIAEDADEPEMVRETARRVLGRLT